MIKPVCKFKFGNYGFEWNGVQAHTCIMAVALGKTVDLEVLRELVYKKMITLRQYEAIRKLDMQMGEQKDIDILSKLAKKLEIYFQESS